MDWIVKCRYAKVTKKHQLKLVIDRKCPLCKAIRKDIKSREMYDAYCPDCGMKMDGPKIDLDKIVEELKK